ncbi:MAG: histidine kinase [Dehalococcoidia bacterium]
MQSSKSVQALSYVAAIGAWLAIAACLAAGLVLDEKLRDAGRGDLVGSEAGFLYLIPMASAAAVGSVLVVRRPGHPVGWLFLAFAVVLPGSFVLDQYAAYGALARRGSLPAADFVAVVGDQIFIPWLMLPALILLLTPTGRLTVRPSRLAGLAIVGGGAVAFTAAMFRPYRGAHQSLGLIENPLALDEISGPLSIVGWTALVIMHLGVIAAAVLLAVRFWTAQGDERRQLRWLALAAIPFPILVVGAFVAAVLNQELILTFLAAGFVAAIPVAALLAIEQYRLYDVDRLLSRGLTYSLLTALLVGCYAVVVIFVSEALGGLAGSSQIAAVVATLAVVSLANPARRRLQDALDRRFNRRRFDAVATVRRHVADPARDVPLDHVLRDALSDPGLRVAYWIEDRELWVGQDGLQATPPPDALLVEHAGLALASVSLDAARADLATARAVVAAARPELENERLRAAIALQLAEVRESRGRIVAAQQAERERIERNLHDGAQQRLLALALELRAAEVSGEPGRAQSTLRRGVDELQLAIQELRDLANGLRPAALQDGGLAAALDMLANRTPIAVRVTATDRRFEPALEEAAWFIACESVANAVKHARPTGIDIYAGADNGCLVLTVADDGSGGADPAGRGLRGIADRAEAAGGRLVVSDRAEGGTLVLAELPCGS